MMKQYVFLFLFSVGAHGIRLQPSRQSLQQGGEPESVMDTINAAKWSTYEEFGNSDTNTQIGASGGTVINTCSLPWGDANNAEILVPQFAYGAVWANQFASAVAVRLKEKTALGFKDKTSRDTIGGTSISCEDYLEHVRETTQSPIYDPDALPGGAYTQGQYFGISCNSENYALQTNVRAMIYDWKHHNYGGSFRIPSWLYLCAGMTANGDPHVVNMLGETFDIVSQGDVELVRYPQGADDSSSKLIITASIDKLGQGCHDTYMKKITVSGAWLKESISFQDNEDNGNILVSQGSDARLAPMEMNKTSLTVAGVTQVVVYTAGRPHKGVGTYLNLDLQGFTNLEGKVGGLLGQDSHKKELDLAKDLCRKSSVAKSRAFHQKGNDVPLHEDNRLFHVEIH